MELQVDQVGMMKELLQHLGQMFHENQEDFGNKVHLMVGWVILLVHLILEILMNGPKIVTAKWKTDYTVAFMNLGLISAAAIGGLLCILNLKK